ncbi:MAG: hypothetical protein KME03_18070 [Aphanocapsa lilacina HA4352-LM1]|jgi:hypothetical protein|nr:hypothetical protein [Aphanocapsa lilacina HA4352-LM1]
MEGTLTKKAVGDLEYDLVTVLQKKACAVSAYETYIRDAQAANSQPCVELFQKLQRQDNECAAELRRHLAQVMQNGRM